MPKKKTSFEEDIERLETIVAEMEKGEAPLAELMKNYTEGINLAARCQQALQEAERAMDVTVQEQGGQVTETELALGEE